MKRLAFFVAIWAGTAGAHEVRHAVEAMNAVSIALTYADGNPFAYEKYELYPEDKDVPIQVGNTDAAGRIVFVPGETKQWRVKAYSTDGHGVDLRFESPALPPSTIAADAGPDRLTLTLFGLSAILGIFGAYQLFGRRKR